MNAPDIEPVRGLDGDVTGRPRLADTMTETRWPEWCAQVGALGYRSVLGVVMDVGGNDVLGALNLYDDLPDRFDDDDIAVACLLARHAALAVATAQREAGLLQAVDTHALIGQAQGVLMERYGLDAETAFAVLARYSQDHNVKLYDVAERLLNRSELPGL
jgi:GAF domain-containing protein